MTEREMLQKIEILEEQLKRQRDETARFAFEAGGKFGRVLEENARLEKKVAVLMTEIVKKEVARQPKKRK